MAKTEFDEFLQEEISRQKGVAMPVKASILEQLLIKKLPCNVMHPNPEDEFTFPDIGPNYGIISNYVTQIRNNQKHGLDAFDEPIMVEKMHPKGYMILNGHHRWAAAMRLGVPAIPVKVINLALESDIQKILEHSTHEKRASFDLEEVICRPADSPFLEKKLGFPFGLKQKRYIKLGIPALFYKLSKCGYDIWLYSSEYESIDEIRKFFRHYRVHVDGIITGLAEDKKSVKEKRAGIEKMISDKYGATLHIDNDMVVFTKKGKDDFRDYTINATDETWSKEVISIVEEIERLEKDEASARAE